MPSFLRLRAWGVALLIGVASFAWAAERDPILQFGEGNFPTRSSLDYQFLDAPEHSRGTPIITDQRENGTFVVHRTDVETWSVNERAGLFNLSAPVVIPQGPVSIPTVLYSVDAGGAYGRHLANEHDLGLSFRAGSASDRPFYTLHETVFSANASYRIPSKEHNAWLLFLNYSNNRHFLNNVPLPGFAYYFEAWKRSVKAMVGFPFVSALYTPTSEWRFHLGLYGPRRVNAEVGRKVVGPVWTYLGFDWSPLEWERANRPDNSNRLFFDKKRVMAGVRSPLFAGLALDLSGGQEFDRRWFESDSSSTRNLVYTSLPNSWYFETRLSYRFGETSKE